MQNNPLQLWGIESLILGSWGDIKTAKTTLGLTFPKPLVHFDFDQGFHRAAPRFSGFNILKLQLNEPLSPAHLASGADIISKPYLMPVKFPGQKTNLDMQLLDSYIIPDMVTACQATGVKSICLDTGTVLWHCVTDATLQRIQQNNPSRQQLIQIEYRRANSDMRALCLLPRAYGKHLYITHHQTANYQSLVQGQEAVRVGETWDGWNRIGGVVDTVVYTSIQRSMIPGTIPPQQRSIPQGTILTCGLTLAAEGKVLDNPSFEDILSCILLSRLDEMGQAGRI